MSTNQWLQPARDEYPLSTDSLHATHLSRLHGGHDVIGGFEELEKAVLESLLLILADIVGVVGLFERLLAANRHHSVHELGVGLHSESLFVHLYFCVG